MKALHISNPAKAVAMSIFAVMMLFPAVLALHAQSIQIGPNPNPVGNTIQTPPDLTTLFPNALAVTAHNNIDFTNNGKVEFWGSFNNDGTLNNNGTLEDIMQFIQFNNNAGAVLNNNTGALYKFGNGTFWNNAGATFNNYGRMEVSGVVTNYGLIINQPGGYWWNGTNTRIYAGGTFVNNGTYEGWIFTNCGGTVINNSYWRHRSGIVWNYAGGIFINNGHMTTEQWWGSTQGIRNEGTFYNNTSGTIDNGTGMDFWNNPGGTFNNAGTINNDGKITNTAGAVFNNSGTLTNNLAIHNTGTLSNTGTINNTGTVELAAGSAYNFAGGTFNNNNGGTLVLRRSFTFDGATGGTMNLNAGSTLQNYATLTNPAGYTQANNGTLINTAGALLANNGVISGSGIIINDGVFKGAGNTSNNVQNNGTIAPGNSIGTITIIGNYVQNPGSVYQVEVDPTASDRIAAIGTATLNGGTVQIVPSGLFLPNRPYTYTILTAVGGVTGTFANLTTPSAFLTGTLSYLPKDVVLSLMRQSLDWVCETENQCAVAGGLEGGYSVATGDLRNIIDMILGMNASRARNAYDQMGGYVHTAMPAVTFSSYNQYRDIMALRMAGFVSGGPSSMLAVRPVLTASRVDTGNDARSTLLAAANNSVPGNGTGAAAWGFWMDAYGSLSDRSATDISSRYDNNTAGAIFGFDKKITPSLLLGASVGYAYAKVDLKDLSEDARVSSYQGSLYGIYTKGPWYAGGIGSYALNTYDTSRDMVFGTIARPASASYNGHLFAAYLEGGYKVITKYADILPFAAFQATYLARQSFSEDGAGVLSLDADKENTASYIVSVGIRLRKEYAIPAGTLTPEFRVRWDHELSNDNHSLRASFTGYPQTAFTVNADKPDRDRLAAGIGINLKMKENIYLNLSYDGYFSNDTTQNSGMLGFQYKF